MAEGMFLAGMAARICLTPPHVAEPNHNFPFAFPGLPYYASGIDQTARKQRRP